jgi:hypothetical protein
MFLFRILSHVHLTFNIHSLQHSGILFDFLLIISLH